MTLKVRRNREERIWRACHDRKIVYGRRKTGKTFFVREFTRWNRYFFVGEDGAVYEEGREISYEALKEIIRGKPEDEVYVVDEFHRLPRDFLYFLQAVDPRNIVLVTSTLHLARRILSERDSPLLAMFCEVPFSIISPSDALSGLSDVYEGRKLVERATYMREPLLLRYPPETPLRDVLLSAVRTVPHIVSDVFTEEEKQLTRAYRAVMTAVAGGATDYGKIASYVAGRTGIRETAVNYHVRSLELMGIIKRVRVHGAKRHMYMHVSPLFDLYYWLERKYAISETDVPDLPIHALIPRHVEAFVRELLAEVFGLPEGVYIRRENGRITEIDIALGLRKVKIVAEVRWSEKISKKDVQALENKLFSVPAERRLLVVPDPSSVPETDVEVLGPEDLAELARKSIASR